MNETITFWANPKRWPEDAMGYVFLGNAVDRIGKFLFPDQWDGTENTTPELYALKSTINGIDLSLSTLDAKPWQRRLIHELVASRRPEFRRQYTIHHGTTGEVIPKFSSDEWAAGIQEAKKIDAEREPKLQRREASRRFIKKAILDGRLSFVLLPKRGGAFSPPQDRSWWNVKDIDRIFHWCQMNPKDPTGIGVGGDDFQYIFLDESDLNGLIQPRAQNVPEFPSGDPYMLASRFVELPDFSDPEQVFPDATAEPDPADFAVMEMDDWTIEMVLAWIIWRDPTQVVRFDREYHKQLTSPAESQFSSIPAPTLEGLQHLLDWNSDLKDLGKADQALFTYSGALKELKSALRSGKIIADGTDLHSMEWRKIGHEEWKRLTPVPGDSRKAILVNNFDVPIYGDIMFERQQVVDAWPVESSEHTGALAAGPDASLDRQPPSTMIDRIRAKGGVAKLSGGERQIWETIQILGGENSLPVRPGDYIKAIQENAKGTAPSRSTIDRFFRYFGPKTKQ